MKATLTARREIMGATTLDERWADEDEEPQWLNVSSLPYHGGGVMGRRSEPALSPQRSEP